jgi:hypothetical protein
MNNESRILKLVQAAAISPADAGAQVDRFFAQARAEGKANERDYVAEQIVNRYARLAATVGGVTALAGIVPGIGTAAAALGGGAADAAASMKLQVDMTMCLATAFGYDLDNEDARNLAFLVAVGGALEKAGEGAAARIATKAGVRLLREYLRGAALQTAKVLFRKVGLVFTRKALEKAIPFGVGVGVGALGNYALTKFVGRQAIGWFRIDAADGGPTTTLG